MRFTINIEKKHLLFLASFLVLFTSILVVAQLDLGNRVPSSAPSHPLLYVQKTISDSTSVDADEDGVIDEAETGNMIIESDGEIKSSTTSLERYKVSISSKETPSRIVTIDDNLLIQLCGDEDGCEVRLSRVIITNSVPERVVTGGYFYIFKEPERKWKYNAHGINKGGTDNDNSWVDVTSIQDTSCFFTDADTIEGGIPYDRTAGLGLRIAEAKTSSSSKICTLTFID